MHSTLNYLIILSLGDCNDYYSDSEVSASSEDEDYPSHSYSACYKVPYGITNRNNTPPSPGVVSHASLSSGEEMALDPQYTGLADYTICTDEFYADDDANIEEDTLNGHRRRVTSRKLRQLNGHPYAPIRLAINPRVALADPHCPRNGKRLPAPQTWQAQATSIRSSSFITSDALIATLASPRVDSTSSSLDVQLWVASSMSHFTAPDSIQLAGGSIEEMIARCHLHTIQTTGSSLVAMITYMQLAIQCQR